jgi:hypothetical protein
MCEFFPKLSAVHRYRVGFLKTDILKCCEAYESWLKGRSVGCGTVVNYYVRVVEALQALEPFELIPSKVLLLEGRSGWTAIVDNKIPYPDPISAVAVLCRKLKCEGIVACSVPDSCDAEGKRTFYGATQLEMFSPEETDFLNYKRTISVARAEEGWRFDQGGEVQPFEDLNRYKSRRVRDRFDADMLAVYLRSLDIQCDREEWFTGNATMIRTKKSDNP